MNMKNFLISLRMLMSFKFFFYFPELSLIAPISLFLSILFLTFMFKACFNV